MMSQSHHKKIDPYSDPEDPTNGNLGDINADWLKYIPDETYRVPGDDGEVIFYKYSDQEVGEVGRLALGLKHLPGQHDQKTHGRWAHGAEGPEFAKPQPGQIGFGDLQDLAVDAPGVEWVGTQPAGWMPARSPQQVRENFLAKLEPYDQKIDEIDAQLKVIRADVKRIRAEGRDVYNRDAWERNQDAWPLEKARKKLAKARKEALENAMYELQAEEWTRLGPVRLKQKMIVKIPDPSDEIYTEFWTRPEILRDEAGRPLLGGENNLGVWVEFDYDPAGYKYPENTRPFSDPIALNSVKSALNYAMKYADRRALGLDGSEIPEIGIAKAPSRAYYVSSSNTIGMVDVGRYVDGKIRSVLRESAAHEFGHWIERNVPGVYEKAKEFLMARVSRDKAGEPKTKPYKVRIPDWVSSDDKYWVSERERLYLGKFLDPYMGKVGKDYTEIISMGFEMFANNPGKLAMKDPELFDLIVGVVQGNLVLGAKEFENLRTVKSNSIATKHLPGQHDQKTHGNRAGGQPKNELIPETDGIYKINDASNLLNDFAMLIVGTRGTDKGTILGTNSNMPHTLLAMWAGGNIDNFVRFTRGWDHRLGGHVLESHEAYATVARSEHRLSSDYSEAAFNSIYDALDRLSARGLSKDIPVRIFRYRGGTVETTTKHLTGQHDQKTHGRRGGGKSRTAAIPAEHDLDENKGFHRFIETQIPGAKMWYGKPTEGGPWKGRLPSLFVRDKAGVELRLWVEEHPKATVLYAIEKKPAKGALGYQFIQAMKAYADQTGKPFGVGMIKNKVYFDRFDWLQDAGEEISGYSGPLFDGKIYIPGKVAEKHYPGQHDQERHGRGSHGSDDSFLDGLEGRAGLGRAIRAMSEAVYRSSKDGRPVISEIFRAGRKNTAKFNDTELLRLAEILAKEAMDPITGRLLDRPIGSAAGGFVNSINSAFEIETKHLPGQHDQKTHGIWANPRRQLGFFEELGDEEGSFAGLAAQKPERQPKPVNRRFNSAEDLRLAILDVRKQFREEDLAAQEYWQKLYQAQRDSPGLHDDPAWAAEYKRAWDDSRAKAKRNFEATDYILENYLRVDNPLTNSYFVPRIDEDSMISPLGEKLERKSYVSAKVSDLHLAMAELRSIIDEDALPVGPKFGHVYVNGTAGRSYCDRYNGIYIERLGHRNQYYTHEGNYRYTRDQIWHEMGHIIEMADPGIYQRTQEFFDIRTRKEQEKYFSDSAMRKEKFKKDRFIDKYMGKIYSGTYNTTEILSCGLQYLATYPATLAEEDPEYFRLIVDILHGYSQREA